MLLRSFLGFILKVTAAVLLLSLYSCLEKEENTSAINLIFHKPDSLCVFIDLSLTKSEIEKSIIEQKSKLECQKPLFCNFIGKVKLTDNTCTYLPYKVKIKLPNESFQPEEFCVFYDKININIEKNTLLLDENIISLKELDSLLSFNPEYLLPLEVPNKIRINWSDNSNVKLRTEVYEIIIKHLNKEFNSYSKRIYGKSINDLNPLEMGKLKEDPRISNNQILYLSFVKRLK